MLKKIYVKLEKTLFDNQKDDLSLDQLSVHRGVCLTAVEIRKKKYLLIIETLI